SRQVYKHTIFSTEESTSLLSTQTKPVNEENVDKRTPHDSDYKDNKYEDDYYKKKEYYTTKKY
ncbi:2608_t:CDS:2, partial [Funneliformis mosseae]